MTDEERTKQYARVAWAVTELIALAGQIEDAVSSATDEEMGDILRYTQAIRSIPQPWLRR